MTPVSLENPEQGVWRLGQGATACKLLAADFALIGIEENDALAQAFADRIQDPFWKLELSKSIAEDFAAELAQAEQMLQQRDKGIATMVMSRNPAILKNLLRAGIGQKPYLSYGVIALGFALALAVWIVSLLRFGLGSNALPATASHFFAIHCELSNRTRHLLPPEFNPPQNAVYLLLGRPKPAKGLKEVLSSIQFIRPISLAAGLRSFPMALGSLRSLSVAIRQSGYAPRLRAVSGMFYRQLLGCCHQVWWQHHGPRAKQVVFGHTGLADMARLEQTMQQGGAKTVHLVHGVSVGWNFAAASSKAIWMCGADVDRHRVLYGYQHHGSIAMAAPEPLKPRANWVVFSNYLHPTHPAYLANGPKVEIAFINLIAQAVEKMSPRPVVQWQLHPAFDQCVRDDVQAVQNLLAKHGFKPPPESANLTDLLRGNTVITAPSTLALDALVLGRLPILVSCYPLAKTAAYRRFPLLAGDSDALAKIVRKCGEPQRNAALFEAAFKAVAPARRFTVDQL